MSTTQATLFPALSAFPPQQIREAKQWLKLALLSIGLSGIAPLLLLAGRASVYAEMEAVKQWFVPVLVIHVNLSVGLWFLALAMMLWRLLWPVKLPTFWHGAAVWSFFGGIVAMVLAPLAGGGAFTSNYIPVQNNPLFFLGLSLVLVSLLLMLVGYVKFLLLSSSSPRWEEDRGGGKVTKNSTAPSLTLPPAGGGDVKQWIVPTILTLLTALACFAFSIIQHPEGYGGESYYEAIWWGGGHVLQFVYVQLAMVAWLWLAEHLSLALPSRKMISSAFWILTLAAMVSPVIYWLVDITHYYHIKFFSWQMNIVTGTVPGVLALWMFYRLRAVKQKTTSFWVLLMSLLLFLSGGLVGFLIEGSSTVIPAHYHGSTVGVTLALMGVAYLILPVLGGRDVSNWKMAKWQPVLYGVGQLLHVIGFAIAGMHGAGRKVAGSMEGMSEMAQMGMQLVRLGGILAVIGGGLFVVVMLRGWRRK